MKQYERWAIVLIVAYLLVSVPNPVINIFMAWMLTPAEFGVLAYEARMFSFARGVLRLAVSVVVAVWLYRLAKRDGGAPWVWAMLGLFFNVLALVLYFAMQIYERLRAPTICAACGYDNRASIQSGRNVCAECGSPLFFIATQRVAGESER